MAEFFLFLVNIFYLIIAVVTVFWVLRLRDNIIGVGFDEIWKELKDLNIAVALWLSAWVLGICYLAAALLA